MPLTPKRPGFDAAEMPQPNDNRPQTPSVVEDSDLFQFLLLLQIMGESEIFHEGPAAQAIRSWRVTEQRNAQNNLNSSSSSFSMHDRHRYQSASASFELFNMASRAANNELFIRIEAERAVREQSVGVGAGLGLGLIMTLALSTFLNIAVSYRQARMAREENSPLLARPPLSMNGLFSSQHPDIVYSRSLLFANINEQAYKAGPAPAA